MSIIEKVEWQKGVWCSTLVKDCPCEVVAFANWTMPVVKFYYRYDGEYGLVEKLINSPQPPEVPAPFAGTIRTYDDFILEWINESPEHLCNEVANPR